MAEIILKSTIYLAIVYILAFFIRPSESVCNLDLQSQLRRKAPLLLHSADTILHDASAFILPRMNSALTTLHAGEEVEFLCPGDGNRIKLSEEVNNVNKIKTLCDSGSNFTYRGRSYALNDITCSQEVEPSINDDGSCTGSNKKLQVGFPMSQNEFLSLIDICFNEEALIPSYLNYTLVQGIEKRQMPEDLDNPDKTDYYNNLQDRPASYYSCSNQQSVVSSILGSARLARQKIVCSEPSNYLVKTYLASSSDFVFESQQKTTRYYINTVPMWLSITNGNWQKLEDEIRLYASNISREESDLIIYSGTLDVTTLPDNRRKQKPIYLASDNKLPVPQWVWKVVYEPQFQEGIVFILVNNPYQLRFAPCRCVCPQTKWTLAWNRQEKDKGYIYCCTVENFRDVFPALPQIQVTGLLTKNRPYTPTSINIQDL